MFKHLNNEEKYKNQIIKTETNALARVSNSIKVTNKLLKNFDSRLELPSDDFRVHIPDANFRKYLEEEHYLVFFENTVAYRDVKNIPCILCGGFEIQSLEGLQYFVALTVLICGENQLTSLELSKNSALEVLECDRNQLKTIDVSANPNLVGLNCNCNELISLNVSGNQALTTLQCMGCQLTMLDISLNIALTAVDCRSNNLTSLNLPNNHNWVEGWNLRIEGNPGTWWQDLKIDPEH